jgi:class 3 adenylate cyclase
VPVDSGRYLGLHIPGARYIELEGDDHLPWVGDFEPLAQPLEEFLADVDRDDASEPDRAVKTVLFADIVGSTEKAVELGDARWAGLLERYHALVRRQLVRYRGSELDTAGDGVFACFDGPARAVRCACSVSEGTRAIGLEARVGLHTGECELVDGKLGGIAVHVGARIAAEAEPGEVLVSGTVKDLVAGSDIEFREHGLATLTGIPGQRQLFAVEQPGASPP